jgi:hypothetical protein
MAEIAPNCVVVHVRNNDSAASEVLQLPEATTLGELRSLLQEKYPAGDLSGLEVVIRSTPDLESAWITPQKGPRLVPRPGTPRR